MEITQDYNAYKVWKDENFTPNKFEQTIIDVVRQALLLDIFYTSDMYDYVKENTDISDAVWGLKNKTENGVMGMVIYYARGFVEAENKKQEELSSLEKYQEGQVIGTICVKSKRYFKATIVEMSDMGIRLTIQTTKYQYDYVTTAVILDGCIKRAVERGWRKA